MDGVFLKINFDGNSSVLLQFSSYQMHSQSISQSFLIISKSHKIFYLIRQRHFCAIAFNSHSEQQQLLEKTLHKTPWKFFNSQINNDIVVEFYFYEAKGRKLNKKLSRAVHRSEQKPFLLWFSNFSYFLCFYPSQKNKSEDNDLEKTIQLLSKEWNLSCLAGELWFFGVALEWGPVLHFLHDLLVGLES